MAKTGILLVNLGTPDSPATGDVRRYLKEFLLDSRVIDIPWLSRQLLVRGIIAPFRAPKSAKVYQEIWMDEGSPLMVHGSRLLSRVQRVMGEDYQVELAMRYQNPSIEKGLNLLIEKGAQRIVIFPLFPQYASATVGSVHQKVMDIIREWQNVPDIRLIRDYFDHPAFIDAIVARGREHDLSKFDHVLFSYHGLPERQIRKADDSGRCLSGDCCRQISDENGACYRAQCFATTRALVEKLGLREDHYSTCFQSRLGKDPWIQPYTSDVIRALAEKGVKNMIVFCPAFVADCIETIDEIAVEYAEEFREFGGESLTLVESLNSSEAWVSAVRTILLDKIGIDSAITT